MLSYGGDIYFALDRTEGQCYRLGFCRVQIHIRGTGDLARILVDPLLSLPRWPW